MLSSRVGQKLYLKWNRAKPGSHTVPSPRQAGSAHMQGLRTRGQAGGATPRAASGFAAGGRSAHAELARLAAHDRSVVL